MPFCFSVFFLVQCRYEMHPGNQLNDRFAQPDIQKQEEMNGIEIDKRTRTGQAALRSGYEAGISPFTGAFRKRIPHKRTVDRRNRKNGCSL